MAFQKNLKRLISLVFGFAALVLLCLNGLLIYVITGPRSLSAVTPYIESALAPPGSPYKVKVESSELIWDSWKRPIAVHAKNLEILDSKGLIIAHFPEVGVSLYFFKLLTGHIELKSLEVIHPAALLIQGDDGNISFGFTQVETAADNSISSAFALLTAEAGSNPVTHLHSLTIRHADISIKKSHGGIFLHSPDASLEITRREGYAKGTLSMPLQFDQRSSQLDMDFKLDKNGKTVSGEAVYTDIPSTILQQLFPSQHWMESTQMPLSGWAHIVADFNANVNLLDFVFEGGPGKFEYPSLFESTLHIQRVRVEGSLTDQFNTFTVKKGILDFKPSGSITFKGTVHKQGDDYGAEGYAETANIAINDVHNYWPLVVSPHTRKWVTSHISQGKIEKANIAFHFKPGDFKLKDIPDEDLSASLTIKNATIKYMPKHPEVSELNEVIKFTGESMDAIVSHGKYLSGTVINSGRVRFPDFVPDDVRMFLEVDANAPARDVVQFMSLPDIDKAKNLNLSTSATGQVKGTAKLDFIAFSANDTAPSSPGHINYTINADLIDVSQNNFMGKRDIANANMKINLTNKGIKAEGRASVNQIPMSIDLNTGFGRDHETTYVIKSDIPVSRLPDFDVPTIDFIKGTLGVNATFTSTDSKEKTDATVDLTQTTINLPEHGFSKKLGEKAILRLSTEKLAAGNTLISPFYLKGNNYSMSGKAEYNRAAGEFSSITFDSLHLGEDDLNYLNYSKAGNNITLEAKGRSFDAAPYLLKKGKSTPDGYNINLKTDRLILGEGRVLHDVSVQTDCSGICRSADINAKLPSNTPFAYSIHNGVLNAFCDNAGELIRVLGIFDGIKGGKMVLKGAYKDNRIEGLLEIKDYTLSNAPVLTKIFTIASLTGIVDTLSGHGISFTRLTAPFAWQRNVIILKDAKAHGPAIGLTTDGVINMNENTLDLSGSLVPSYTMNSLIGNIPLIGSVLMGGKGKGLIAINYSVKGDMKDPAINVNPLSVLTPGFLRNVFDIFDEPAPDFNKIEAEEKKTEEKHKQDDDKAKAAASQQPPAATQPAAPAQPTPAAKPRSADPSDPNK